MPDFFEYKFTPAMIEENLSAAPSLLRNWRTRGHLDHIGEPQGGGRWLYSASDLIKIAIVLIFQKERVDLVDAFQFAERTEVDVLIQLYQIEFEGIAARFTSMFRQRETGEWVAFKVRDAAHLDINASVTTVLDARAIAQNIPDELKAAIPVPTTDDLHKLKQRLFSRSGPMTFDRATGKVDVPSVSND